MGTVGKIVAYTVFVMVAACLLAPPLYWLGSSWVGELPILKGVRFSSYFNRSVLIVALVSIWPFVRWLGLRRWTDLGLTPNPRRFSDLALGIGIGMIGLWLVVVILILTDQATIRSPFRWHKLPPIVATAVLVPLIEEFFFRGVLFGLLRRALSWKWALAFLSLFFSVLHFLKPAKGAGTIRHPDWTSGFEMLSRLFWQFSSPELVIGGGITLFLVGWILGYTVLRTRSLYLAAGLHGGWIFALRSFAQTSKRHWHESVWLGQDIITGVIPILLLLLTLAILIYLLRDRPAATANVEV
ncbi:MAG: hypothetical protein A2289_24865 [Deltaproteobacteria bacterium RIFOXYA12_FULL_58_15]|nr:MAG: hypothetical protein A2289_24865 [Deltaproteobacteria bacterium RIFOXYA12_FULL_58_15]OGR10538.1 MAG: hypothetical protein A2341_09100 [Deltaproteobacteria bacterium RIFOXYB12_FULL_58_9]